MNDLSGKQTKSGVSRARAALIVLACCIMVAAAIGLRVPGGPLEAVSAATVTVLHMHGNTDDGTAPSVCTGNGAADIVNCNGPFLKETSLLAAGPAARWGPVSPAVNGSNPRTIYDPSWVWRPATPKRIAGPVNLQWWASCGGCAAGVLNANWTIKIFDTDAAAATPIFQTVVTATPSAPDVVEKLSANFNIPEINISGVMVLQIDPVFIDVQENTNIYYDSQLACPGAASGVCDSTMTVVVYAPGEPTPTPTPTPSPTPTPETATSCALPTYDNYQPPPGYPRRDGSGEPSIGVNWNTGNIMAMSRLRANRLSLDDSTSPANPVTASWFSQTSQALVTGLDPILFTDSITGRTIAGELQGAGGSTNGGISDDDLTTFTQTFQTGGPTQGIDHQTIGGGPPKPGIIGRQPTGTYPHLFYYASQQTAYASVATSFDGGVTYEPAVPAYTLSQCTGLHGHIKVGSDGTVYLPNKNCGGKAAVVVSEDNGLNWTIRPVPTSSSGKNDASVAVGEGGRIYLSYMASNNHVRVAVSDDRGLTWHDDTDLMTLVTPTLTAAVFPAAVVGDNDRAAVFFLATDSTQPGNPVGDDATSSYKGTWYPYIATTCDNGKTWSVVRADNDPLNPGIANPVQQGVICTTGTTCPGPTTGVTETRNLLDFNDLTVDAQGRVLAVYADGCNFDHPCINVLDDSAGKEQNQGVARLTVIRQRGGMRLFAEYDAASPGPPLTPFVDVKTEAKGTRVLWGTPDDRGSAIKGYRVYRVKDGKTTLLAAVGAGKNVVVDKKGRPDTLYVVTAVNKFGESRQGKPTGAAQ